MDYKELAEVIAKQAYDLWSSYIDRGEYSKYEEFNNFVVGDMIVEITSSWITSAFLRLGILEEIVYEDMGDYKEKWYIIRLLDGTTQKWGNAKFIKVIGFERNEQE